MSADLREFAVLAGMSSTAMILTEDERVPLEWLAVGDRVVTRDGGLQTVRWIARTALTMQHIKVLPELAPVTIRAGAQSAGLPERDVITSPSQLVRMTGADGRDVLVTADTVGEPIYPGTQTKRAVVTYLNVLLDGHHLVDVEGLWMGSVFTADLGEDIDHPVATTPMTPIAPILDRAAAMRLRAVKKMLSA
jgi:Hint domain-containing protein